MAKVTNQIIPESDVLYETDPARPYTLGEAYRQAVTEGHLGNITGGALIVGKSPISGRPSQRGPGTAAQAPQRACFECCAEMWRNSPQYFKDCIKVLYNDRSIMPKDRQIPPRWFSTPYSTFQALCLKKCREVGSCAFYPFNLLACLPPLCEGATIGYTTLGMHTNETQQLSVVNPHAGGAYVFQIGSGGGLITEAGFYTAPATNPNCDENPIINLVCEERVIDSISLAINGLSDETSVAYWDAVMTGGGCTWAIVGHRYNCEGVEIPGGDVGCGGCDASGQDPCMNCCLDWVFVGAGKGCDGGNWDPGSTLCTGGYVVGYCGAHNGCGTYGPGNIPINCVGITDIRSDSQKNSGCCPPELL